MRIKQSLPTKGEAIIYLAKRGWKPFTTSNKTIYFHPDLPGQRRRIEKDGCRWFVKAWADFSRNQIGRK